MYILVSPSRYYILPLVGGIAWFLTLSILLIYWLAEGRPVYPSQINPYIAYVLGRVSGSHELIGRIASSQISAPIVSNQSSLSGAPSPLSPTLQPSSQPIMSDLIHACMASEIHYGEGSYLPWRSWRASQRALVVYACPFSTRDGPRNSIGPC